MVEPNRASRTNKAISEINTFSDAVKYQEQLYDETSRRYEEIFGRVLSSISPLSEGVPEEFQGSCDDTILQDRMYGDIPQEIILGIKSGKMKRERLLAMVEEAERRRKEKEEIEAQRVSV